MLPMPAYVPGATSARAALAVPTAPSLPPAPRRNTALLVCIAALILAVLGGLAWTFAR